MSRVYIIIVNWNGWKDTIECLESILLLTYSDYRVVVCDNGSEDESTVKLSDWCIKTFYTSSNDWQILNRKAAENGEGSSTSKFTLIANGVNLGFGGGTNVGLRYALACGDAEYCWLLNNDTVVESLALSEMVKRMVEKPNAGMCGSTLRDYDDRTRNQALGGAIYYKWMGIAWHIGRNTRGDILIDPVSVEKRMDYIVGASLLVRSTYLKEVGLMAEKYFLFFEEIDWITRCQGRYSLAYAPNSVVYHKVGASIGTATNPLYKSYQCDYFSLRNRLIFSRHFYPSALLGIYFFLVVELLIRLLCGRWDLAGMICRLFRDGGYEPEIL